MCKWSMMQNASQQRRENDAELIAKHIAERGVTRVERGRRTVSSSDMKLAVRGEQVVAQ